MKHLANCTPDEFMAQVVKLRAPFCDWIKKVGKSEIDKLYADRLSEEDAITKMKAVSEYLGEIIAVSLESQPELTRELLCLSTFTEMEDFNAHSMMEYISAVFEMYRKRELRDFFTLYLAPCLKTSTTA